MRPAATLKRLGLAAAALFVVAAGSTAISGAGCGTGSEPVEARALPALDRQVPRGFQTATFAFG